MIIAARLSRKHLRFYSHMVVIGCILASMPEAVAQQTIRVATREVPPFAMRDEDGQWSGISIELVKQLREDLAEDLELEFVELGLAELLDALAEGEVDLAAAALTVTYEREQRIDFSHPYFNGGLGIALPFDENSQGLRPLIRALLSPTFLRVVAGLLITMLAVGVAIYFFERHKNREQFGGSALRGVLSGLWWSAVTLTTVGYGDKVPKTLFGRLVGIVWMFSGLFIIASFTAAITSALTLTELRSQIRGPGDLNRVRVATVRDSTSAKYLSARRVFARSYPGIVEALESLANGECDAVVYDAPLLRYQVRQQFEEKLFVLPSEFELQDYALALPPDSTIRETVNQALLRIKDSPQWQSQVGEMIGERVE